MASYYERRGSSDREARDRSHSPDAPRFSPDRSAGDTTFNDVDIPEVPRIARPPRSQQRSPSSVDSLPLHTRGPTAPSSKIPVSPSWSGSGGLTRSYNMRDLSLTETLEAPMSSDSKSPASPPLWGNNAASSLRKELQAGENGDRMNREKKLPSLSLDADVFQPHGAVPVSPSYIPAFDFDSSPADMNDSSQYSAKSLFPEDFLCRTPGSTPLNLPAPPRHHSRPNSPASSDLSHPPVAKYPRDAADSGSEYSPDELSDREPTRKGSRVQKSKSPPRSPAPTMMKTSKSLAALDSLVAQEQAEFGRDEEAAREARRRGERESSSHSDESRTPVEATPASRRTSTDARKARMRRISERALDRKFEQDEEVAEERELRTERHGSEGGTWWKSGGLVVGGRELKDRDPTSEDNASGSKDWNASMNHLPTQVIVTSPSDRSLRMGAAPTSPVRGPSSDEYKVARTRSTSPPAPSSRVSRPSSPFHDFSHNNLQAMTKVSTPLPSPPSISPTSQFSPPPAPPASPHGRTTSPAAPLREPVSAPMLNTPESFSNSRNIFSRHALNLDAGHEDEHIVPPLPSPREALRFANNSSTPLRSPTAFEFSAFPSAPLETLSPQPEVSISSDSSPRIDSSPEFSFSSTPGGSPGRQKNLPILRAKSSRRASTNATRRAAAAGQPMPTLDSLDDIGGVDEHTDEDATPRKAASRRGEGLLRASDSAPLSSSDFADAYGEFDNSPSRSDSEQLYTASSSDLAISANSPLQSHPRPILDISTTSGSEGVSPRTFEDYFDADTNARFSSMSLTETPARDVESLSHLGSPTPEILQLRRPSEALSDVRSDLDVFHDVPMAGGWSPQKGVVGVVPDLSTLAEEDVDQSPSRPKADAKTRAAAFVADLRRARLEGVAAKAAEDFTPDAASTPVESVLLDTSSLMGDDFDFPSSMDASPSTNTEPSPSFSVSSPSSSAVTQGGYDVPSQSSVETFPELEKLGRRRRPLPACLQNGDLKKARTAGERAIVYAKKINALSAQDSGVNVWISFVRGDYSNARVGPPPTSPNPLQLSRSSREEGSTASSVFPMRSDAFRAKEIPHGSFVRDDLIPTVPYPGVLPPLSTRYSNLSIKAPSALSSKAGFFSTLGRKGSKRSAPPSLGGTRSASAGYVVSSPLGPIGVRSPSASSLRPITGPRAMPSARGSFEAGVNGQQQQQQQQRAVASPSSAVFPSPSINSIASSAVPPPSSPFSDLSPKAANGEKLDKLADMLPHVSRPTLEQWLVRAGDDEFLAINLYLEDEKRGGRK